MAVYLIASEPVYPFFVAGREGRRIDIKSTEKEREAWDRDRQTDRHIGRQTGRAITLHLVLVEEQDERSTPIEIWTHTHTHTLTHLHSARRRRTSPPLNAPPLIAPSHTPPPLKFPRPIRCRPIRRPVIFSVLRIVTAEVSNGLSQRVHCCCRVSVLIMQIAVDSCA